MKEIRIIREKKLKNPFNTKRNNRLFICLI